MQILNGGSVSSANSEVLDFPSTVEIKIFRLLTQENGSQIVNQSNSNKLEIQNLINIDKKNYAAYFNLQRLDENLITEKTIKNIYSDLNANQNLKDKNVAYGHFVLAKSYRKKKQTKMEIK